MQDFVTPLYEDLFKEPRPDLKDLVSDIPSPIIIEFLAFLNAQIYLMEDRGNQLKLLDLFLSGHPSEYRNIIHQNYTDFIKTVEGAQTSIFSRLYIISFIHYEIINYRVFNYGDISSEHKLNILKAYCLIVSQKSLESQENSFKHEIVYDSDFYATFTWPIFLSQIDSGVIISPDFSFVRGICLLNYFQFHTMYAKYVESFYNKTGVKNAQGYITTLRNFLRYSWNGNANGFFNSSFSCSDKMKTFFTGLSINPKDYQTYYRDKKEDSIGLKSKPLLHHNDRFIVLDWGLIINKLYEGLVFDFFNNSGIKDIPNYNSIPKLKKIIGLEITEKFIFRRVIGSFLTKKYCPLIFSENNKNGEPDAYFRKGRNIILFEIKDAFFPNSAIISGSYETIKEAIDEKYNSPKKGTSQLIKQLKKLQKSPYEPDEYDKLKIKAKNIKIFPVIIYTDKHFGMPVVSNYLADEFNAKLNKEDIRDSFKKIYNLTFLNLDFIYQYMEYFKKHCFIEILEGIHHNINVRKKKHDKFTNIDNLKKYNENMETIFIESSGLQNYPRHNINDDFDLFNLGEGLTEYN